jgi:hypothetical protein
MIKITILLIRIICKEKFVFLRVILSLGESGRQSSRAVAKVL